MRLSSGTSGIGLFNMKTAVITGATSGIGYAVCAVLLKNGYNVIGIGRSEENCTRAKEKLLQETPDGTVTFFTADLMQQSQVRRVSGEIRSLLEKQSGGRLNALVNNAGCVRSWYMTTAEGYEQQFALNHLAGFLLTHELWPCLNKGGGRVLMTASGSHKLTRVNWDDIMYEKRYSPLYAYKQSKLCNLLFAVALNERFAGQGIRAFGIDPGLVKTDIGNKDTGKLVGAFWQRRKRHGADPAVPAEIYLGLLTNETVPDGLYYSADGERSPSRAVTQQNAERLFGISEKLCGIKFGVSDIWLS